MDPLLEDDGATEGPLRHLLVATCNCLLYTRGTNVRDMYEETDNGYNCMKIDERLDAADSLSLSVICVCSISRTGC